MEQEQNQEQKMEKIGKIIRITIALIIIGITGFYLQVWGLHILQSHWGFNP